MGTCWLIDAEKEYMAKVPVKVRLKQEIVEWIESESKKRKIGWHTCLDKILDEARGSISLTSKEVIKSLIKEELKELEKKGRKI